mmetsp:Transcript_10654/g.27442  ORF Transcript_10654/g.27442 Transcript_10654/m.27442 type:complete len:598 (-) Transcript_10654:32-1825(-)|eukprot:CAMPEP_0195057856 /NCGR_PEP_ID=MMETSP0448-20130528/5878_1 /TAXON_ID=66468 /ORGANISM="Heterocapsa triquestra, Strain CCMP 448" /LENGTH=597 /DNA_ID=CAMNT_0040087919 /DNA_START=22 /DNA_END=1815 /DNA_ORIENTATION=+
MKFGKSIGTQQEGDAELHYVDYKALKKSVKDVVERLQASILSEALTANTAFEEELAREIRQVNACFAQRQRELMDQAASFADGLQEDDDSGKEGSPLRQDGPFRRLVGILGDVDQLRKYAVWNAVAVVKILKKRRKQTNFGLEDVASERAGWLSRQSFFSGSDFAELHTAIESLGHMLMQKELAPAAEGAIGSFRKERESHQCPICLETISDMVELSCSHRFCWKCFVLGPIAHQPGEYRITQCPVCRQETSAPDVAQGIGMPASEGTLTRFLHTYFPQSGGGAGGKAQLEAHLSGEASELEMRDVVGELVKALHGDSPWQPPSQGEGAICSQSSSSRDFFQTLPMKQQRSDKDLIGNAQKLQWLQLASSNDPLALDSAAVCSLCWEPLLMEAVATTPCKHDFHRVCVVRVDLPQCPLCQCALPFSWFLQPEHPCYESGFRCVHPDAYRPAFPGGPSKGTAAYPLQRPPPIDLHGPVGMTMRSFLHCIVPSGEGDTEGTRCLSGMATDASDEDRGDDVTSVASSSTEEEDSESEDADMEIGGQAATAKCLLPHGTNVQFAYSAFGRMRLADRGAASASTSTDARATVPQVLLIDQHV